MGVCEGLACVACVACCGVSAHDVDDLVDEFVVVVVHTICNGVYECFFIG